MVTRTRRIQKSSRHKRAEYMLLWRVANELGQRTVDLALAGNVRALAKIEQYAYTPKKKHAVAKWVEKEIRRIAKGK